MSTGGRLLSQVMPDTYRQGYTYRTKLKKTIYDSFPHRKSLRCKKRMGSKILRHALKENLTKQLDNKE